jgi:hypothetical protein
LRFFGFIPARLAGARDSGQVEAEKKINSIQLILSENFLAVYLNNYELISKFTSWNGLWSEPANN